jgi:hypothetical protein
MTGAKVGLYSNTHVIAPSSRVLRFIGAGHPG